MRQHSGKHHDGHDLPGFTKASIEDFVVGNGSTSGKGSSGMGHCVVFKDPRIPTCA